MPKIIENLNESILTIAKQELLTHGYSALTMRELAKKCNIAVGTMYNYYPSKDMLVANVILADWKNCLSNMEHRTNEALNITSGLEAIFDELYTFRHDYKGCFNQYTYKAGTNKDLNEYHTMLCSQITSIVEKLLKRLKIKPDAYLASFTTEMLLTLSSNPSFDFNQMKGIINRLYPNA